MRGRIAGQPDALRGQRRPGPRRTSSGRPNASGRPLAIEGQDEVGQRPCRVDPVLDEDDRRGASAARRRRARPGTRSRRRGPGWRSARRGRGSPALARARRPARAAAARPPDSVWMRRRRRRPARPSRARPGHALDHRRPRPRQVLQPERDVVLDPVHHELREPGPGTRARPGRRAPPAGATACRRHRPSATPVQVPGNSRGTSPATARANVLLPDPDGPMTSRHAPAGTSRSRSRSAGRRRPVVGEPDARGPRMAAVRRGTRPGRRSSAARGPARWPRSAGRSPPRWPSTGR